MAPITPFARAVETLQPEAGGRAIVKLLDGKATRHAALNWKAGRCNAPRWALDLLAAKIRARSAAHNEIARQIESVPDRPGLQAGAQNLAKYLARRA